MIMFGSFLPSRLVGFSIHQLYSGIGADIVMESISLIDPDFGEQTAQACAIACLHQLRATILWRKAYRAIVALGEKLKIQRSARNNSMAISVSTSVLAFGGTGWESVGGQLLASGVLLLSGYQDIGLRARIGAVFGFFMALAFGISALGTAVWARLWGGTAICAAVLCFETWLILRWWRRRTSA